jgi:hypothetical protein
MITRPAEYPIPRCDDAVMFGFGQATHYILLDAFSGYHQIKLSEASAIKTAFYAPHGRKYMWVVMPFELRNCSSVFIAMMHDLKELWTSECEKEGIIPSHDEGTTSIMNDTLLYAVGIEHAFIIVRCICKIGRKYHLTWKLKKPNGSPLRLNLWEWTCARMEAMHPQNQNKCYYIIGRYLEQQEHT